MKESPMKETLHSLRNCLNVIMLINEAERRNDSSKERIEKQVRLAAVLLDRLQIKWEGVGRQVK